VLVAVSVGELVGLLEGDDVGVLVGVLVGAQLRALNESQRGSSHSQQQHFSQFPFASRRRASCAQTNPGSLHDKQVTGPHELPGSIGEEPCA
jgi:hypothetical protein